MKILEIKKIRIDLYKEHYLYFDVLPYLRMDLYGELKLIIIGWTWFGMVISFDSK